MENNNKNNNDCVVIMPTMQPPQSYSVGGQRSSRHLTGKPQKSGVVKRISDMYPNIIVWHCLNHRLELAVADSVSETTGMNHFHSFVDKLYSVYSRSALNQQELRNCAKELDAVLRKIGRVLDVRWVSSSFRTVSTVWESFEVL
ncbi:UNVERIFIED_CONTAM: hypothetical protein FKN15_027080 [Acipenser sinensis]